MGMRHERGRPPYPEMLTPAEQRVLAELRAGRQNAEIATRLGVSVNTVRYHVSNMLGKLGRPNRAALRAWKGDATGRRRGWAGIAGLLGGRGASGVGVLAASVVVGVAAAVLLVVGSGRVTVPSGMEAEPSAVAVEVVEPQDWEADEGAQERGARVARDFAVSQSTADVEQSFVEACGILSDEPPVLATTPPPPPSADRDPPKFRVNEDGCIILPNPSLAGPPVPAMQTLPMRLADACIIQFVEPPATYVSQTVSPHDEAGWSVTEGRFPILVSENCEFVPDTQAGAG
jgi:DNA-binding CsgD family transcriptional regulator